MKKSEILKGLSVSSGVGIGQIHRIEGRKVHQERVFSSVEEEKLRLRVAMDEFCARTYHLFQNVRNILGQEDALIVGGQIMMARDLEFVGEIYARVEEEKTAETALVEVFALYLSYFGEMEDELMSQRSGDLTDMRDSILEILSGERGEVEFSGFGEVVLCVEDLTPSMMAGITAEKVSGILCQRGGITSHCAILARSSGIPAIFGVPRLMERVLEGETVIVDGSTGLGMRNPNENTLEKYQEKARYLKLKRQELEIFKKRRTQDARGEEIPLMVNVSDLGQLHTAVDLGADGVGLFRTEYLYMSREELPTEEEQYRVYCRLAGKMEGKPVMIRTLDIGGDKEAPCLPAVVEDNPFLGMRAIRYCLANPDIFMAQLRGILRATGVYDNISILIPMVTTVEEILLAKGYIQECREALISEGYAVGEKIPVGIMVETPSSAMILDLLLEHVDYVSVGTNDLTQYMMVVDRGNVALADYYSPFHPSVLRILKHIITSCNQKKVKVTICGEAVCDPRMIPVVLSFGQVQFSVAPSSVLGIRKELSRWSREQAELLASRVMALQSSDDIEAFLSEAISECQEAVC